VPGSDVSTPAEHLSPNLEPEELPVSGPRIAPRGGTPRNAIVRFGAQFAAIAVNLAVTPFIIRSIGVESFGLVGVINALIALMAVVTASLTFTVGRNLTFAVEGGDNDRANGELSTAVYGLMGILAALVLPALGAVIFLGRLITIPAGLASPARVLFLLALLSLVPTALSGPLGAGMFARNRLDLMSGISLARTALFAGLLFLFFVKVDASLTSYGVALLSSAAFACVLTWKAHQHLLPSVVISVRHFRRQILAETLSLGTWMTVAQVGALLFLQTDLIVANRFVGATATGQLAAIAVVSLQLRTMGSLLAGLFAPIQTALSARGDRDAFPRYLLRSIRLTTLFMALLVGVFCGSAKEVLSLWLGPQFAPLTPVAIVLTAYLIPTLGVMPSWNALLADGKMKIPALVTLVMGLANVALAIVLARALGLMGIALSGCVMLTSRNAFFTPWYVSRVCGVDLWKLWRELGIGTVFGVIIAGLTYAVMTSITPASLITLAATLALSLALGALVLLPLGMRAMRQHAP
jgi:O-antigen/teichoic acid export membrane protein